MLRGLLSGLINKLSGFEVVAEASNGKEVLNLLENGIVPQIIILDLNMPLMDGYKTAEIISEKYPEINVLILTMYDTELIFFNLFKLHVKGILSKNTFPQELESALFAVSNSQYYFSTDDMNRLARRQQSNSQNILSDMEVEFLKLSVTEMTYKQIASIMKMTESKIDHVREKLFEKLEVKSRVGLAVYAIKSALVPI